MKSHSGQPVAIQISRVSIPSVPFLRWYRFRFTRSINFTWTFLLFVAYDNSKINI